MLDVSKELREYQMIDLEERIGDGDRELPEVIGKFTNYLERLGKDQLKFAQQLEEIFLLIENSSEQNKIAQAEAEKKKQEIDDLLEAMIALADSLEDIYKYAFKSVQGSWKEQVSLLWKKIADQLEKFEIKRIEGTGTFFDPHLHVASEVKEYPGVAHGQILDVIKCGYMYKEKILRKAEVIVNKLEEL